MTEYMTREEAIQKWLFWKDRTPEGQQKFHEETNWMPVKLSDGRNEHGKPAMLWELTFVLKNNT